MSKGLVELAYNGLYSTVNFQLALREKRWIVVIGRFQIRSIGIFVHAIDFQSPLTINLRQYDHARSYRIPPLYDDDITIINTQLDQRVS